MLQALTSPMRKFLPFSTVKLWNTVTPSEESDDPNDQVMLVDSCDLIDKPAAPSSSPFFPVNGLEKSSKPSKKKKKDKTGKNMWVVDDLCLSNRDESALLEEPTPSKSKKSKKSKSTSIGEQAPSSSGKRKRRKSGDIEGPDTTSSKK